MKRTRYSLILSIFLLCVFALNGASCSSGVEVNCLRGTLPPNSVSPLETIKNENEIATDFSLRLFKENMEKGKNTLISPLSVLYALSMTANGAEGETLEQMETVLGMSKDELNLYLYSYMKGLYQSDKCKLNVANSIWFTDDKRFTVNEEFLQINEDYYGADIYSAPFTDKTCKEINDWVDEKTDGMIPEILDEIPSDAIMYLVNALAFDAKWEEEYEEYQVKDGTFTKEDGTEQKVEFMKSIEGKYFETENAKGFMKYYKNSKYAFVGMLPNEDVSLNEYVSSLDGKTLHNMISSPKNESVSVSIPKFETEYGTEMSGILYEMGIKNAFDVNNAQFQKLGVSDDGNIFISRVIHKTFISVKETGTKAGAATIIEMKDYCAAVTPTEVKTVRLDRPFMYMIVDCENNVPLFIGTMNDLEK